jgi:hypothetical protein
MAVYFSQRGWDPLQQPLGKEVFRARGDSLSRESDVLQLPHVKESGLIVAVEGAEGRVAVLI